jgi:hypothetical protein
MSNKVMRELEKLFARYQCTVDVVRVTGRNTLRVTLRAPDGISTEQMSFSNETGSASKYQQGNEHMVRRFALAHPRTAMSEAISAVVIAPPAPLPPDAVVKDGIAYAPQPEVKPMTTETSNEKTKRQLDRKQVHQLWKWCRENVPQGLETTVADLTNEASRALGFAISEYSVSEALQLEEIKLAEPKAKVPQDRAWAIACVLKNLMIELKMDVPEVLAAIVERRTVR